MPKDDTPDPIEHHGDQDPPEADATPDADSGAGWRVIRDGGHRALGGVVGLVPRSGRRRRLVEALRTASRR